MEYLLSTIKISVMLAIYAMLEFKQRNFNVSSSIETQPFEFVRKNDNYNALRY